MSDLAEKFATIFDGLDRAYGEFVITGKKGPKAIGKANTRKAELTLDVWQKHLMGRTPIGVVPIRDDNACVFGAIDVDSYENFDPAVVSTELEQFDYPIVVCRSKSGGAHIYLFTYEPVPAALMRKKLLEIALGIGQPDAEIFPKQDRLRSKDDIGNWINMPYFHMNKTDRYAYEDGKAITAERFVALVEERAVSKKELQNLDITSGEFSDGPPCLEKLTQTGFPKGSKNNALFSLGVYARMKYPDDWQRIVFDYNDRFMSGTPKEVQAIVRSLDKKKYIYKCQEEPICGACNKVICSTRQYGISSNASPYKSSSGQKANRPCILDEVDGNIKCFVPPSGSEDEPYWIFTIHGQKMDVSIDMIQSQLKFLREYLKKFHRMVLAIDETRWMLSMNDLLGSAEEFEMAPDAGPEGQFFIHLENFCTGKIKARKKDELLMGKPWFDELNEEGAGPRVYFRSPDLMKYLDIQRFKTFKERQIYTLLRRHGAEHHRFMLKGACVSCWSVNPFQSQSEPLDVPAMKQTVQKVEEF